MAGNNSNNPIDPFAEKKAKAISILNNSERVIFGEERNLISNQKQFIKKTTRDPLTLTKQFQLSRVFGYGGVQFGFKRINESKRRARRITKPKFKRANSEISKTKSRIAKRRSEINLIDKNTNIDFSIDLSKFKVDTDFIF